MRLHYRSLPARATYPGFTTKFKSDKAGILLIGTKCTSSKLTFFPSQCLLSPPSLQVRNLRVILDIILLAHLKFPKHTWENVLRFDETNGELSGHNCKTYDWRKHIWDRLHPPLRLIKTSAIENGQLDTTNVRISKPLIGYYHDINVSIR